MTLKSQPVDLGAVVEAALDAVSPAAEAKRILLECDLSGWPRGVSLVWGDPDRLQQVVWNLLSNGVKFTPERGAVRVRLDTDLDQARLTVSDNGPGIDRAFLPHVFEPFRQEDGTITRNHGGLGLGLAIARRLVELHGGQVRAQSEGLGRGAAFEVRFPLRAAEPERRLSDSVAPGAREERKPSLSCPPNVPGLRILVVDDEPDARDLVATLLERCGASVRVAASAREALAEMKRFRPDVLLSDLAMPDEDGYALIRRIRSLPASEGGAGAGRGPDRARPRRGPPEDAPRGLQHARPQAGRPGGAAGGRRQPRRLDRRSGRGGVAAKGPKGLQGPKDSS
jgi:CheY-like chemotaxis protein